MITLKEFIESYFKIKTKDGLLKPFLFNEAQNMMYETYKSDKGKKAPRYIVLKARQLGISTLTEALITAQTITSFHTNALIVAHDSEASTNIYDMAKRFIDNLPEVLKPAQKLNNAKRLVFNNEENTGLDSSIRVMVPKDGAARGSTIQLVHLSEVAFWDHPKEAMTAILQAVPDNEDTLVVIESTANGFNYFYEEWQRAVNGESDYTPIFIPWFKEKSYRRRYSGEKWTEYELEIKELYKLDDEQLSWRRWAIKNKCQGDEVIFRQEYPISPEEAFITSGESVFDSEIVLNRLKHVKDPIKRGYFKYEYDQIHISNIEWVDDPNGYISIYKEPNGDFTAMGGDTAGEGEDYFATHVVDRDGYQMAVYHRQDDEDLFAKQIYCLGMYYKSLISIETNFSTFPIQELKRLGYPWLYMRRTYDSINDRYVESLGFKTTQQSRSKIIARLVEIVRESVDKIRDRETLKEMLTFIRKDGKPQAADGAHDDLVMSLGITYDALEQIPNIEEERSEEEDDDLVFFNYH